MAIFHKTLQHHEDTTEKRDISQEDIEFLKRLQLEMNTQDTKALFPTCPVSLSSDNYYEFSKEDLLRDNWSRKPAYGKVDPTVVGESMKPYVCQVDQMIMGIDQIRQTDLSRRQGPTTMQNDINLQFRY